MNVRAAILSGAASLGGAARFLSALASATRACRVAIVTTRPAEPTSSAGDTAPAAAPDISIIKVEIVLGGR